MKKFSHHKTLDEIRAQCAAQGIPLNTHMYDRHGWDTVSVGEQRPCRGYAIYNVVNGRFYGVTPGGVSFSSSSIQHEHRRWFQQLLNFFYE